MPDRLHVVVVGGGFAGLTLIQHLERAPIDITLIDQRNHQLFQPLLYQVATAALAPGAIARPLRAILRGFPHLEIRMTKATGIELAARRLQLDDGESVPYDMLVLATGVEYAYFGHADWPAFAPSLKSLDDALEVRRRLLLAFEQAEAAPPERQAALLTFVLVGGGPTGVEMAGSIAELARFALRHEFSRIDPAAARIILVEATDRLLPGFADRLARYAHRALERLGVEVRLNTPIEGIDAAGVTTAHGRIDAGLVIWCAGIEGGAVASWLGVPLSRHRTVIVGPDLSVPGWPDVFVAGDLAEIMGSGRALPKVGPVAKQQGAYLGRLIAARAEGGPTPPPFRFHDPGSLAIIGRSAAVVDFGWLRLTGLAGWLVWGLAHILFLIGFRNRIAVFLSWAWEWATNRRDDRLILGRGEKPQA